MPGEKNNGFTPNVPEAQVFLERPRINRLLEKAVQRPIVCIVAGAGFGKTSALNAFVQKINVRTIWIQLSELDNLGERFWENYVSAVSAINGDLAKDLRKISFPATEQQFERYLALPRKDFISNEKYLVIYDDVHLITEKMVLRFLEHRISVTFPNICSVLISRSEPGINIEKLIAKKLLARITEEELRFSRDEMITFFSHQNLAVTPRITSALYRDTEGWAFAIQLAGLLLKNSGGMVYVPQALRTNASRLIDTEIMASLPPALQSFLIKLSLIENHNPDLLREIGKDPSLVKGMEEISSFIRYDNCQNSYRIHHFLLDYLRGRQNELSIAEKKEVWTKTALWCTANNRKMDAIIYYEKTGDYDSIIKILNTLPLILSVQMARFILDILENSGKTIHRDHPEAIMIRIRSLASLGLFEQSQAEMLRTIPRVKALRDSPEKYRILAACLMNLGFIGLIKSTKTKQYDFIDFFKEAAYWSEKSAHTAMPPLNGIVVGSYICRIGAPVSMNEMEEYIAMIGEIVPYSAKALGGCQEGMHELARGEFSFFRGELEEAERLLLQSLTKAREKQQFEIENRCLFYLLRICLCRSDAKGIEGIRKQLKAELEEAFFPNRHSYYDIITGWYYIQTNQSEKIASWLKNDYEESGLNPGVQGLENLVKAKYYFSKKQYPAALAVLESRGNAESLLMGEVEMKALEAVCRYRQSDRQGAFRALEEAYRLAAPTGLFMPFAELGKDMRTLTDTALKTMAGGNREAGEKTVMDETCMLPSQWLQEVRRKASFYAKKLYTCTEREHTGSRRRNGPLSHRETLVLSGLSQGLTRQEIAGAASISPNTVKSVTRSIYNKLGALNQADAVRIAAERGIL